MPMLPAGTANAPGCSALTCTLLLLTTVQIIWNGDSADGLMLGDMEACMHRLHAEYCALAEPLLPVVHMTVSNWQHRAMQHLPVVAAALAALRDGRSAAVLVEAYTDGSGNGSSGSSGSGGGDSGSFNTGGNFSSQQKLQLDRLSAAVSKSRALHCHDLTAGATHRCPAGWAWICMWRAADSVWNYTR